MKKSLTRNLFAKNQRVILTVGILYFVLATGMLLMARFAVI